MSLRALAFFLLSSQALALPHKSHHVLLDSTYYFVDCFGNPQKFYPPPQYVVFSERSAHIIDVIKNRATTLVVLDCTDIVQGVIVDETSHYTGHASEAWGSTGSY